MNHRHLLPDEIDLLVDDEVGFGVAPLRAHLRECADCTARVEEARFVVDALEELPHFAPSFTFADRVMAQVPVFVPWHVAARDSVRRWVPQSRPARVLVLSTASAVASVLTFAMIWIATQSDLLVFTTGVIGGRFREIVNEAFRTLVVTMFGDQVFVAIQQVGAIGLIIAALGIVGAAAGAVFGLKAIATASSRRRS